MKSKTALRKFFTIVFAGGATLALGFLSFAGMFMLSSSLILCSGAFILASAYEGQVNSEGVGRALRRLFTEGFLKKGIARQYLENFIEQENEYLLQEQHVKEIESRPVDLKGAPAKQAALARAKERLKKLKLDDEITQNTFFQDYKAQKKYVEDLQVEHANLHKLEHAKSSMNKTQRQKLSAQSKQLHKRLAPAKQRLALMETFLLKQIENPPGNNASDMQTALEKLLQNDREKLITEMNRKKWIIRFGAILALGGGVSSFFATFSAMQVAIASLTILSAVPGGILITLSVLAAAGYALLLYQAISDMVQEYSGKWRSYFEKRNHESNFKYILRCTGVVLGIALGIFATIATAGTWWYAVKNGASLLNVAENAANAIRAISIAMMTLPSIAFTSTNSVASIDNISRSSYRLLAREAFYDFKKIRYFNPFHFLEKLISYTAKSVLFLGHVISIGIMSDHLESIPPAFCASTGAASEALTDLNYMPDNKKQHNHESIWLTLLFLPVTLVVGVLKCLATAWDWLASGCASFAESKQRMFPVPGIKKNTDAMKKPQLSPAWKKQEEIAHKSNPSLKSLHVATHHHKHCHHDHDHNHDSPSTTPTSSQSLLSEHSGMWSPQAKHTDEQELKSLGRVAEILKDGTAASNSLSPAVPG